MNPPAPDLPPDSAERIADIFEFLAKVAGSLGALWLFIARVGKPFLEWNRKRRTAIIREALNPELAAIARLPSLDTKLQLSLDRQDQIFNEMELFVEVIADNRDRLDDMTELLDATGFASRDRREASERRKLADDALAELQGRLRSRRRRDDDLKNLEDQQS